MSIRPTTYNLHTYQLDRLHMEPEPIPTRMPVTPTPQFLRYDDTTGIWTDNVNAPNLNISRIDGHLDILQNTKDGVEYTGRNNASYNHKRKEIYGYICENNIVPQIRPRMAIDDDMLTMEHVDLVLLSPNISAATAEFSPLISPGA